MFLLYSLLITVCFNYSSGCDILILKSNGSTIVGKKLSTVLENRPYAAFWKVPYAQPPLSGLRFKPPKRRQVSFARITYDFSTPYNNTCSSGLTEDCLYLSIYMPISDNKTSYPVLVWMHEESNLHEPDFFIDENILLVTVSYRTSIMGFLNTGDEFAEGNMGAKDMLMALKWIRENIILFDGDVNKVTIVGSGTAANIVGSLILSAASEDLFTRVIIQSGSALSPADYRINGFDTLKKLYRKLKGPYEFNRTRLYEILAKASINQLMSVCQDLYDTTEVRDSQRLINSFGPTVEVSRNAFMNKCPLDVYKRGMENSNVEVMMGYTSLESLYKLKGFVRNKKLLRHLNNNFQYLLPFEGAPDEYGSKRYRRIANKIMDFYFANGTITERSLRRYAKYVSDQIIYPLLRQGRFQASCTNVYLYRFTFRGSLNIGWEAVRDLNYSGATAGDEICYLFRCKLVNDVYTSAEASERQFIRKIARLWANFAKCGNPTPDTEDDLLEGLKWDPLVFDQDMRALNLGKQLQMVNIPEEKRMTFWNELKNDFFPEKIHDEL